MVERKQNTVGICIPVYYSGDDVPRVLTKLLDTIVEQDYPKEYLKVFLSMQRSNPEGDAKLDRVVEKVLGESGIDYHCIIPGDDVRNSGMNTNVALYTARDVLPTSSYIKIMNQDDFFDSTTCITSMVDVLDDSPSKWLISDCIHTDGSGETRYNRHTAMWPGEKMMVEAVNHIGCPSVVMFEASLGSKFDIEPEINYAMDCSFYVALFREAGLPIRFNRPDVVIRMWEAQLSEQVNIPEQIELGKVYMRAKYGYK